MNRFSRKNENLKPILAAAAAGILVAVAVLYIKGAAATPPPLTPPPAASEVSYSFVEKTIPSELIIPAIGVNAAIQPVGVLPDGSLQATLSYYKVGWYKYGPVPGAPGSAVIEGHLDTIDSPYAVFFDLDKLKPGDQVDVRDANGQIAHFKVIDTKLFPYDAPTNDIFATNTQGESMLNLITCEGKWIPEKKIYDERLVVFTARTDQSSTSFE